MLNSAFCWEKCSCKLNLILISFRWLSKLPVQSKLLRALHAHCTHTTHALYWHMAILCPLLLCILHLEDYFTFGFVELCVSRHRLRVVPLLLSPSSMLVYKPREKNPGFFFSWFSFASRTSN